MIANQILDFYQSLTPPDLLPANVETLNPYITKEGWDTTEAFYHKFYNDNNFRKILFGINPGRLGGGLTGAPFTDPICMEDFCGITNPFPKRHELSSKFVYEMINFIGGPKNFYANYFITGISPLGYISDGKNLNYYDIKGWKEIFEESVVQWIKAQLQFNIDTSIAYSIGKGENIKFLKYVNKKHNFFEKIESLPHPRWVMQYRLKSKHIFLEEYKEKLPLTN
ncbi:uracil-DNA glycosylase family protein [Reichenbachiella versicolor]|uniref:uracil-DNA glycosylase family protein n=1 Tax=Reichenbachiella versicolor TaxID=1821036 RepID=UPI0013A58502|nr:uracil-DNA glycosylase family protein [Reichenbachiella versicolor]